MRKPFVPKSLDFEYSVYSASNEDGVTILKLGFVDPLPSVDQTISVDAFSLDNVRKSGAKLQEMSGNFVSNSLEEAQNNMLGASSAIENSFVQPIQEVTPEPTES